MTLQLLLAQAGDGRPVIETPLPAESLLEAPLPAPLPSPTHLYNMSAEPDSLREQRWALVVPNNTRGRTLEAILSPLCERRAEEQGRTVAVYRAEPGMNAAKAREFVDEEMYPTSQSSREHARYVLLAGTPEELSMELQEEMTGDGSCFVGRLPFEREDDFAAYVEKVVDREREAARSRKARAVFLTAQDGSSQVRSGHDFITGPAARRCAEARAQGYFPTSSLVTEELPAGAKGRLLELAGVKEPSLFFTLSHGVGGPLSGWRSAEEQRQTQGNMWLGDWTQLTAEDVHQGPFLPGGIWFYFACFGAGTPVRSVYQPWMEHLVRARKMHKRVLEGVERSRPVGTRPFISALPQAALANPEGPLAVIGHLDQAWICAFHDPRTGQTHTNRLEEVLTSLVEGHRAGPALHSLSRYASKADRELRKHYQADAVAQSSAQPLASNMTERAYLWMERHDVTHYTLLGDPAVRLVDRAGR
ncbi:hypothetical protein [Vitiosangium sp. GDMCC 1.1324]|uniref:hypothetical protein n=1 Tax=Vitiosangium sp. (strain GDMCC 1.1324) TaxID=2138576 RepID=UPI000D39859B|nr:hypothetical protein [Vitiosangium sp. GDMCC 1.1324]PTL75399.1 hypothetical protein DAT35_54775 [Vitiosangium sp. GDMCC 1.1324]